MVVIGTVAGRQDEMFQKRSGQSGRRAAVHGVAAGSMLFAVVLAGCGSDSDEGLSVQEFRTQTNEICAESGQEIGEAVGAVFGGSEPTPEQLQDALDVIVSASTRTADQIEALDAPAAVRDDVADMLTEFRAANDAAAAQGLGFWDSGGDPWERANEMAAALGLDTCAAS